MEDLISKLGIEWKLLLAQIVNFVILFLVLKKFLYKPLLNFMNNRRQKIADGLDKVSFPEPDPAVNE